MQLVNMRISWFQVCGVYSPCFRAPQSHRGKNTPLSFRLFLHIRTQTASERTRLSLQWLHKIKRTGSPKMNLTIIVITQHKVTDKILFISILWLQEEDRNCNEVIVRAVVQPALFPDGLLPFIYGYFSFIFSIFKLLNTSLWLEPRYQ